MRKTLGNKIDSKLSKLSFKTNVEDLCKRASRNIHALAKITRYINFPKRSFLTLFPNPSLSTVL